MSRATPIVLAVLLFVSALGILPAAEAAPSVSGLTPTSGPTNGGTTITISGLGFVQGALVEIGGVKATNIQVVSASQITAVTPARTSAAANQPVVVTNPDGSKSTSGVSFTFTASPSPTVTGFSPGSGSVLGGTSMLITGTGFSTAIFPKVTVAGVQATVQTASSTELVVVTNARVGSLAGDVAVTNSGTSTPVLAAGQFTYTAASVATLTGVSPITGSSNGGTAVTLTGTNFSPGARVLFGTDPATSVAFVSATRLIVVTPPQTAGFTGNLKQVDVTVLNPDDDPNSAADNVILAAGYTFEKGGLVAPAPVVNAITPVSGPATGGTPVIISGTNFVDGKGLMVEIGGAQATDVKFVSNTQLTAITPAGAAGTGKAVKVTNPDGVSGTNGLFEYKSQVVITGISPATVPTSGTSTVTLTGEGLSGGLTGCRIFVGGIEAALTGTGCTTTQVQFIAPPGPSGAKDVIYIRGGTGLDAGLTATLQLGLGYTLPAPPTLPRAVQEVNTNGVGPNADGTLTLRGNNFIKVAGTGKLAGTFVSPAVKINGINATVVGVSIDAPGLGGDDTVTVIPPAIPAASVGAGGDPTGFTYSCVVGLIPAVQCIAVTVVITNIDGQSVTTAGATDSDTAEPLTTYYVKAGGPASSPSCNSPPCDQGDTTTNGGYNSATGAVFTVPGSGFAPGHLIVPDLPALPYRVGATTVKVGGQQALITSISATQIQFLAPVQATAGAKLIEITNPDGQPNSADSDAIDFDYAKPGTPTIQNLATTTGSVHGGTVVTLNGVQGVFAPGATVFFGDTPVKTHWPSRCDDIDDITINCVQTSARGIAGNAIRVLSPGHAAGTVSIKVVNLDGQTFTLPNAFTYIPEPSPVVTSITPERAPGIGGNPLTIFGSGFSDGGLAPAVPRAATTLTFNLADTIADGADADTNPDVGQIKTALLDYGDGTAVEVVSPPAPVGPFTVTKTHVYQNAGRYTAVLRYTDNVATSATTNPASGSSVARVLVDVPVERALPDLTLSAGTISTARDVVFTLGSTFGIASWRFDCGNGLAGAVVTGTGAVSGTRTCNYPAQGSFTATLSVKTVDDPLNAADGLWNSVATTVSAPTTIADDMNPITPAPAANPNPTGSGAAFHDHFADRNYLKPAVFVGGSLVQAQNITVTSAGQLDIKLPNHPAGVASVVVVNPDGQIGNLQNGFRFLGTQTGVTLAPNQGTQDGGAAVALTGLGFDPLSPAPVFRLKEGAAVNAGTASAVSSLVAGSIRTPADPNMGTSGQVDVQLVDQDGQTLTILKGYSYTTAVAPSFTSLSPSVGSVNGGTKITIKGNGFQPGIQACMATNAGPGTACTVGAANAVSTTRIDGSTVEVVTKSSAPGPASIWLANPNGVAGKTLQIPADQSLFSFLPSASPVITSIDPTSGNSTGGTTVTLRGANFPAGAKVFFGSAEATNVAVASATLMTATTPANEPGPVAVTVQAPSGLTFTVAPGYTYLEGGLPVVTPPTTTTSTSSTDSSTGPSTSSTTSTGPGTNPLSAAQITTANKDIEVTVTRDGNSNIVKFTLPSTLPASLAGVQIWRSNSPFVLAADLPVGSPEFASGQYVDTSPDAKATTEYVVTAYYTNGQGKATNNDPATVPGFTEISPSSSGSSSATKLVYFIVPAVVLLLLVILLVVVLVGRSKKQA